jgi:hypothetical protein
VEMRLAEFAAGCLLLLDADGGQPSAVLGSLYTRWRDPPLPAITAACSNHAVRDRTQHNHHGRLHTTVPCSQPHPTDRQCTTGHNITIMAGHMLPCTAANAPHPAATSIRASPPPTTESSFLPPYIHNTSTSSCSTVPHLHLHLQECRGTTSAPARQTRAC